MPMCDFKLVAMITTNEPIKVQSILAEIVGVDGILRTNQGFIVRTTLCGTSAEDLNQSLFSKLKSTDKNAALIAEWTRGNTKEKFLDNMPVEILE